MNRRTFNQQLTSLAVGATVLGRAPLPVPGRDNTAAAAPPAVPFQLSVMLWTEISFACSAP